ncbi:hypothetical protein [Methanoregula sp.]|uniref:hypothetical protein n=1 Tax=Methanoregula sp. TaxID=2052170 RepID=UPI0035628183
MKHAVFILLAGIACIFMIAAGCTSSSGTATTATPTATPVATTAAPADTTAQPNAPATPAPSFAGNWNVTWTSGSDPIVTTTMTMKQNGTTVTGTYTYVDNGKITGSIKGTVEGNRLTGSWNDIYPNVTYSGPLAFTLSADANSFTGKYASDSDAPGAINNTTDYWNGVRV